MSKAPLRCSATAVAAATWAALASAARQCVSGARCTDGPIRAAAADEEEDEDEDEDDDDEDEDEVVEDEEEDEDEDVVLDAGKARGSGSGGVSCVKAAGAWR